MMKTSPLQAALLAGVAALAWLPAQAETSNINTLPDDKLAAAFANPPDSARPWVYCFWLDGNITKEGITADLEAMKRAGIGGTLVMEGGLGNPQGPVRFLSPLWREMFQHFVSESARLGLEVNMNNGPGWAGSSGPWITPKQSMRRVVVSETVVEGPARFDSVLALPPKSDASYADITVLAFPEPKADKTGKIRRIANVNNSKSFGERLFSGCVVWPRVIPTSAAWPQVPREECVPTKDVLDLSARLTPEGRLTWEVPPGRWIVQRIGHALAGGKARAATREGQGLECDKMSKAALESHFNAMMAKLIGDVGPLAGKVLVSTHSDSWEAGSGNWTDGFREEFQKRRGYDPLRYLPVLNGLVVESLEVSERFLWDWRQTVADLVVENYAGHLGALAKQHGLRLSIEAYDGPCDDMRYAGRADEPMCEFWQGGMYQGKIPPDLAREMASAAHIYGKPIVGSEAFTDWKAKKFSYPAVLKPLGDWAFCEGVNRFAFTEWTLQPWTNRSPGLCFSTIGTKYERTLTWWEYSLAWHRYVARCQHLLRQGLFVADVCFLSPEGAPSRFVPPIPAAITGPAGMDRPEYDYDGCNSEVLMTRMSVKDGRVVLPDGMSYSLLILPSYDAGGQPVWQLGDSYYYAARPLPKNQTMTPATLAKIKELVAAGATVLGTRPLKSPSLSGFPACDQEVTRIADELWGKDAGVDGSGEHRFGKGRVIWGQTPEAVLAGMNLPPDFRCGAGLPAAFRYIHRRSEDGTEIYFVANKNSQKPEEQLCSFRVTGKQPELWWPETGRTQLANDFEIKDGVTRVPLRLDPSGSVFVIFRQAATTTKGTGKNWIDTTPVEEITGPWQVSFDPKWGGPAQPVTFEKLQDWSKSEEPGIKFYSGTAIYRTTFQAKKGKCILDLGKVQVMADVTLNRKPLGVLWKPPFKVDVSDVIKDGENTLEVKVVNLWINRLIGDEQLPEDSVRNPGGALKAWPQWLQEGKPSPTGRVTFATQRLWKKDDPLVESGLLGPVTIQATAEIP